MINEAPGLIPLLSGCCCGFTSIAVSACCVWTVVSDSSMLLPRSVTNSCHVAALVFLHCPCEGGASCHWPDWLCLLLSCHFNWCMHALTRSTHNTQADLARFVPGTCCFCLTWLLLPGQAMVTPNMQGIIMAIGKSSSIYEKSGPEAAFFKVLITSPSLLHLHLCPPSPHVIPGIQQLFQSYFSDHSQAIFVL